MKASQEAKSVVTLLTYASERNSEYFKTRLISQLWTIVDSAFEKAIARAFERDCNVASPC